MTIDMSVKKFILTLSIAFILLFTIIAIYVYATVSYNLPSLEQLENPKQNFATQIISADGEVLDHFYKERRVPLSIDSIPKDFINALISVEDKKFRSHWGVHISRIMNAMIKNIITLHNKEGASTISMQLARNLYFNQAQTLNRKVREAFTAVQIEKAYTKDEILEMYANTVNFGRGAYGIQVASEVYFDKAPMELSTSECAFLVGILKAPERYNGIVNMDRAITRRNLVLSLMLDQDYINESQFLKSAQEPINLAMGKSKIKKYSLAPHFVEMVRQSLSKNANLSDYDLYSDGLIIQTTLNAKIQKYANEAVEEHLNEYQKTFDKEWSWARNKTLLDDLIRQSIHNRPDYKTATEDDRNNIEQKLKYNKKFIDSIKSAATTIQVGLCVIDPTNGAIIALVGASPKFMRENPDAKYSINHVTQIHRQPGSSFKPFVYTSSLMKGLDPSSMVECGPYTYTLSGGETWSPSGSYDGASKITLTEALTRSVNTVSARLITQNTTPSDVIALAQRMGINSKLLAVPALSLGAGGEVEPIEMTSAYGTFVNQGIHVDSYFLNKVENQHGTVLSEKKKAIQATDVFNQNIAKNMVKMLRSVVDYGTGRKVRDYLKDVDAGGKTGTTNDFKDAWFVGFTPQLVAGVWVGFDNPRVTFSGDIGYAARAAAPIWGRLMAKIYADQNLPYKLKKFSTAQDTSAQVIDTTTAQLYRNIKTNNNYTNIDKATPSIADNKQNKYLGNLNNKNKAFTNDKKNQITNSTILKADNNAINNKFPKLPKMNKNLSNSGLVTKKYE